MSVSCCWWHLCANKCTFCHLMLLVRLHLKQCCCSLGKYWLTLITKSTDSWPTGPVTWVRSNSFQVICCRWQSTAWPLALLINLVAAVTPTRSSFLQPANTEIYSRQHWGCTRSSKLFEPDWRDISIDREQDSRSWFSGILSLARLHGWKSYGALETFFVSFPLRYLTSMLKERKK